MGVAIILRKTSAPCSAVKLNVESLVVLSQTFAQHGKKTKFISNSLKTMTNLKKKYGTPRPKHITVKSLADSVNNMYFFYKVLKAASRGCDFRDNNEKESGGTPE